MNSRIFLSGTTLFVALALTACGGGESNSGSSGSGGTGGQGGGSAAPLAVAADATALKFQQETLNATGGQPITVNFNNPSATAHNWVLVQPGQEQAVADAAAAKNGDTTGVAGVITGGKPITNAQETINVPAQQPGTYPYICTVPGHYAAGMKGTLTVK